MEDKAAVRAQAERLGLAVATKPDSQDICFVPSGSYDNVVAKLRPDAATPGEIVTLDGSVVGQHDGIARYTVGQAKRLGAASSADGERRVVVGLDAPRRRVIVGPPSTGSRQVHLRDVNWLTQPRSLRCTVKLRAREIPHAAEITPTADGADVMLDNPALAAPGQACVFYDGDRVLGGGFIRPTLSGR
jgi:tRNA-uridine 2-sulfurtransferase